MVIIRIQKMSFNILNNTSTDDLSLDWFVYEDLSTITLYDKSNIKKKNIFGEVDP